MWLKESVTLFGDFSFDPDGARGNPTVKYEWQILNLDGSAVIDDNYAVVELPSTPYISITGTGNLEKGKRYKV